MTQVWSLKSRTPSILMVSKLTERPCMIFYQRQELLRMTMRSTPWDGQVRSLASLTSTSWKIASQECARVNLKVSSTITDSRTSTLEELPHTFPSVDVVQLPPLCITTTMTRHWGMVRLCWLTKDTHFITTALMWLFPSLSMVSSLRSKPKSTT